MVPFAQSAAEVYETTAFDDGAPLSSDTKAGSALASSTSEYPFLAPPQGPDELGRLGPYRVLGVLGSGGMGVVFRAEDPLLKRQVALKVMLPQVAANSMAKARFLREARAQATFEHDHIITVFQVGEDRGVPFIAMPLLKGQTLADALKARPVVPVAEAVRIAREMAEGLAAAHEHGLIHRDIKPANVWLEGARHRVKILDFGLARADETTANDTEPVTVQGTIVGTPAYMSPEQARGESLDARTDVFSLGIVLYQMLTGRAPFMANSATATLVAVVTYQPSRPSAVVPGIPPQLDDIVMQLLAKPLEDRLSSAARAAAALGKVESSLSRTAEFPMVEALPTGPDPWASITDADAVSEPVPLASPVRQQRRPWPKVLGALGLVGLVLIAAQIIIKVTNKDGTVTELKVPEGSKVEVIDKGKTVAVLPEKKAEPTPTKKEPLPPTTYTWKPIPVGESQFDRLDANEIPKDERFAWQPKELVGVIGSHARRSWWGNNVVAVSPDGSLAATGGTDITIWDMKTQTPKMVIPSRKIGWGDDFIPGTTFVQFHPDGKRLLCTRAANGNNLQMWDISGPEPKLAPFGTADKADLFWCTGIGFIALLERGDTALAVVWEGQPAVPKLRCYDLRGVKPEPRGKDLEIRWKDNVANQLGAAECNRVLYVAKDHMVRQVTVKDGQFDTDAELPIPLGPEGNLRAITPDGKKLAVWADKQLQVWDLSATPPRIVHRISEQEFHIHALCVLSPDGKWLTAKHGSTAVFRLDAEQPKRVAWLDQTDHGGGGIAFSADGRQVILGNFNGLVRFWDFAGPEPKELAPFDPATAFRIPYGSYNTSLDPRQGRILLPRYDAPEGKLQRFQLRNLTGTRPAPAAFLDTPFWGPVHALGQDRFVLIPPDNGQPAQLYRFKDARFEPAGEPFGSPNQRGNVSPDGRHLVLYTHEKPKQLEGWDLSTDPPQQKWQIEPKDHVAYLGHGGSQVWFSADNRWFATQAKGDKEGEPWKLVLWRNDGSKPVVHVVQPIEFHPAGYRAAFSPDGRYLAHTPKSSQEIVLLDLNGRSPREVARYTSDGTKLFGLIHLAFHPNGKTLAVGDTRCVCLFDVATMQPIWDWQSPGPIPWLQWADDGRHLVTHNGNMTVYVLRLNDVLADRGKR